MKNAGGVLKGCFREYLVIGAVGVKVCEMSVFPAGPIFIVLNVDSPIEIAHDFVGVAYGLIG